MKILFFDGYCSICNSLVDWGLAQDRTKQIKFASLQGKTAKSLLPEATRLLPLDTVVYVRDEKTFFRSDAILYFLKDLNGPFGFVSVFLIIPKFIRDFIYTLFAKNRYRLFAQRQTCRLPTANERDRLLD